MKISSFDTRIIEAFLKENNMSVASFCKICGISRSTYRRVMNNENCRLNALFKIAKVIGVQLHQLFEEEIKK